MKEAVKGSLLGIEEPVNLSATYRATFLSNAKKDEATGEPVMGPEEFVNAIAPADEDYVSVAFFPGH
jgi:solute carrier family 25 (mitochondrial aspartate/glutamate transporter), member 12/13